MHDNNQHRSDSIWRLVQKKTLLIFLPIANTSIGAPIKPVNAYTNNDTARTTLFATLIITIILNIVQQNSASESI